MKKSLTIRWILLSRYGISPATTLRRDQFGMINESWFVGDDLVMTIFLQRPLLEVELICGLVNGDTSGLLPRILAGDQGPATIVRGKVGVMWRRTPGEHFVGPDHSEKSSIPESAHQSIAESFWVLHGYLAGQRTTGERLGQVNYAVSRALNDSGISFSQLPACLHKDYIADYLKTPVLALRYPTLVHQDFERENVLHARDGKVTGVVDTDSLRMGDLLFEYVRCMMNFAFTDPEYQSSHLDYYMAALKRTGMIRLQDIALVPDLLRSFAAMDLISYYLFDRLHKTNLSRLSSIYDSGLARADKYFSS